jgi:hypothetical protein
VSPIEIQDSWPRLMLADLEVIAAGIDVGFPLPVEITVVEAHFYSFTCRNSLTSASQIMDRLSAFSGDIQFISNSVTVPLFKGPGDCSVKI